MPPKVSPLTAHAPNQIATNKDGTIDFIEAEQAIIGNYVLEVSSPGFERRFFKFQQHKGYIGEKIRVALRDGIDGKRVFTGILVEVSESSLVMLSEGAEYIIESTEIERSSLVFVG